MIAHVGQRFLNQHRRKFYEFPGVGCAMSGHIMIVLMLGESEGCRATDQDGGEYDDQISHISSVISDTAARFTAERRRSSPQTLGEGVTRPSFVASRGNVSASGYRVPGFRAMPKIAIAGIGRKHREIP